MRLSQSARAPACWRWPRRCSWRTTTAGPKCPAERQSSHDRHSRWRAPSGHSWLRLRNKNLSRPLSGVAMAQSYRTRPVQLVVGFPPGGTADIVARLIGRWLSERLGQPFIVENQPGASSNIAVEAVVRASPDGYTLLQVVGTNAINATL